MKLTVRYIYEIIWLLLSIGTLGLAIYDWVKEGWNTDVWQFMGLSVLAFGVYLIRGAQRRKEAKKESDKE